MKSFITNPIIKTSVPKIINRRRYSIDYEKVDNSMYNNIIKPKKIVIGISGATGTQIGVRLLEILKELGVETHLVISKWGIATLKYETEYSMDYIRSLPSKIYSSKDVTAPISSGSFLHDGMIVAPCSMKSLSAIRTGYTEDLLVRAADVTLKERRKLLLVARETPLSDIHLDNMLYLSRMGVTIFPPVPAFYTKPKSVDDIIEQTCGRILDSFGIIIETFHRWDGINHR